MQRRRGGRGVAPHALDLRTPRRHQHQPAPRKSLGQHRHRLVECGAGSRQRTAGTLHKPEHGGHHPAYFGCTGDLRGVAFPHPLGFPIIAGRRRRHRLPQPDDELLDPRFDVCGRPPPRTRDPIHFAKAPGERQRPTRGHGRPHRGQRQIRAAQRQPRIGGRHNVAGQARKRQLQGRDQTNQRRRIDPRLHVRDHRSRVVDPPAIEEQVHGPHAAPPRGQQLIARVGFDTAEHRLGLIAAAQPTECLTQHQRRRQTTAALEREPAQLLGKSEIRDGHRALRRIGDHV
ncbi:hypothetical protein C1Y40_05387 [Mycobacterium talmoniae]|uniref:Uncharacterized protein n=1 Tax=Mycobacterium talmoniae TaxID=1858794 RepID=A0A2S8BCU0_9MYCO|nr:hypothetical protein C1Y40_05387 [Mycobacterium talmoniae]